MLQGMGSSGADAALAVGDLGYGIGESQWCDFVREHAGDAVPFQLLAGNHDEYESPDGDIEKYAECLPSGVDGIVGEYGSEYLMDLPVVGDPLVRVIMASPAIRFADGLWAYADGDDHERWLRESIREARQAGIPWVVVAAHKPCPSIGVHSCETEQFALAAAEEGADVVLHGHEHAYMRTHQLGGEACDRLAEDAISDGCLIDGDDDFIAGDGTVFVTVGTGGRQLRPIRADDPAADYFAAWSSAAEPTWGYLDIQADPTRLSASFIGTGGAPLTDAFVIAKG